MSSYPNKFHELNEDEEEELYREHADMLQSGVLNTRRRAETNAGMGMFEGYGSLIELPKSRTRSHTALAPSFRDDFTSKTGGFGGDGVGFDADDLRTRAFAEMAKGGGGLGYATRSAYHMAFPALLFFVLGFAPFAVINGLWAQIVVFRNHSPEGNSIGTKIGSIYNAANIFPFIYVAMNKCCPIPDRVVIPVLTFIGVGVALGLGFGWKETATLFGFEFSYIIFLLSFLAGGVGCTLGVVLYSYTARFRPFATTALSFGMGICGTAVTGLAILQRLGLPDCPKQRRDFENYINAHNTTAHTTTAHPPVTLWKAEPLLLAQCIPSDYLSLNFDTRVFFSVCAGLMLLALVAFFIIDCCTGLMAPHEDPDFFFRDYDKTQAEEEEERRQAERLLENQDEENEEALREKDGTVRFSLQINADDIVPIEDTEGETETGTANGKTDAAPDAFLTEQAAARVEQRLIWRASLMPCFDQFVKAFLVYFIAPGMGAYLTNDDSVVSVIMFVASAGNMVGRISTGFVTIWKLWILNLICVALFVYEFVVAAWHGDFPITPWVLPAVVLVSSFLSGYVSTQVYMSANRSCIKHFNGDTTHAKEIRRYVSLANQVGMLVGTYGCLAVASTNVFSH